nr:hypothetical protein pmam_411 [Pithovirus mammoth]
MSNKQKTYQDHLSEFLEGAEKFESVPIFGNTGQLVQPSLSIKSDLCSYSHLTSRQVKFHEEERRNWIEFHQQKKLRMPDLLPDDVYSRTWFYPSYSYRTVPGTVKERLVRPELWTPEQVRSDYESLFLYSKLSLFEVWLWVSEQMERKQMRILYGKLNPEQRRELRKDCCHIYAYLQ